MPKRPTPPILVDVPRPSASSVMEAFYGGDMQTRKSTRDLPMELIDPDPTQPRRHFDGEQLATLTDSIRELGLIQAIVVRTVHSESGDRYQIICGERRFRACTQLGMKSIRAELREVDDATAYKLALAENVQRNSLTPIEEAQAYQQLIDEGMSQSEVARALGIDRRRVSEKMLLLALPEEAQELLSARADTFTERHARLLAQADPEALHGHPGQPGQPSQIDLSTLARKCADGAWSTRRLEGEIARQLHPAKENAPRLFENIHYALNKRGGFTLTVRARSRQEVARTISELEEKLRELRGAFENDQSARADKSQENDQP